MKRMLALAGVVILVLLYVSTLVTAIINSPLSVQMFKASVAMTIIVPVLIFGYRLIAKVLKSYLPSSRPDDLESPEEADHSDENASAKNE